MGTINIAWHLAPDTFEAFKKWHKLACQNFDKSGKQIAGAAGGDPLSAEERWKLKPKK